MTEPLRILMVTPQFEPHAGGVESHVREVGDRLADRGHAVTVLTADAAPELDADAWLGALRVVRVRGVPQGRDLRLAPGLPAAISRLAPDVVHAQGWHTLVPLVTLAAAQASWRPTVVTFHSGGHSSAARERLRGIQRMVLRPWLRRAGRLVAVSEWEAGLLARQLRFSRRRFVVIPNGADLPLPPGDVTRDPGLVVAVGRLEAYKGHDRLIAAMPALLARVPDARLRIAGAGPDEGRLRTLAARLGVADRLTIAPTPAGSRTAMASLLARAGAVALLSRFESQGIAAWEAAAAGAPLVVSTTSALGELVAAGLADGVPPAAGPAEVATMLAAALERSSATADPRRAAPPNGPVRLPSWDVTTDRLEALYRDLLEQRGRAA